MKIKRYFAPTMREAIRIVREEQGPDAVILSNRRVEGGVEIIAAVDYDENIVTQIEHEPPSFGRTTTPAASSSLPGTNVAEEGELLKGIREMAGGIAPTSRPSPRMPKVIAPSTPVAEVDRNFREPKEKEMDEMPSNYSGIKRSGTTVPKPKIVWSQEPMLLEMRQEIRNLRSMLEGQLSGLAWGDMARRHPQRARLVQSLLGLGITPALARKVAEEVNQNSAFEQSWQEGLDLLGQKLIVTDDDIISQGGVIALVGPTGVGKTTTVAKLAARFALRHGRGHIALLTTDSYRIGAHEQLRTFARILGVPFHVVGDANELGMTLGKLSDKRLILIDTAGMSQRDVRLSEQFAMLAGGGPMVRPYLALSATTQHAVLDDIFKVFRKVDLAGAIITKADEATTLGAVLSVLIQEKLSVAYVGDGQRVPEDLQPARSRDLIQRCVSVMRQYGQANEGIAAEVTLGKVVADAYI